MGSTGGSDENQSGSDGERRRPFRPPSLLWARRPARAPVSVGEMYWVDATLLRDDREDLLDVKPERPVVVVVAPREAFPVVTVSVRTDERAPEAAGGVTHPATSELGLEKEGVFTPQVKWAAWDRFTAPAVRFIGWLEEPYRTRVMEMVARGG